MTIQELRDNLAKFFGGADVAIRLSDGTIVPVGNIDMVLNVVILTPGEGEYTDLGE